MFSWRQAPMPSSKSASPGRSSFRRQSVSPTSRTTIWTTTATPPTTSRRKSRFVRTGCTLVSGLCGCAQQRRRPCRENMARQDTKGEGLAVTMATQGVARTERGRLVESQINEFLVLHLDGQEWHTPTGGPASTLSNLLSNVHAVSKMLKEPTMLNARDPDVPVDALRRAVRTGASKGRTSPPSSTTHTPQMPT